MVDLYARHPLSRFLDKDDEIEDIFVQLWKDGIMKTSNVKYKGRGIEHIDLMAVCAKFEKFLLVVTSMNNGVHQYCINYRIAMIYVRGLVKLLKKKCELLMAHTKQVLDPIRWKAFAQEIDVVPVCPSRVNVPKKQLLPQDFGDDLYCALEYLNVEGAMHLIRKTGVNMNAEGIRSLLQASIREMLSMSEEEIQQRILNTTFEDLIISNLNGDENDEDIPALGFNTITGNPFNNDETVPPVGNVLCDQPISDHIQNDGDGVEEPRQEEMPEMPTTNKMFTSAVILKGKYRTDRISDFFSVISDAEFELMDENYEKRRMRKQKKKTIDPYRIWDLIGKPFPMLTPLQKKFKIFSEIILPPKPKGKKRGRPCKAKTGEESTKKAANVDPPLSPVPYTVEVEQPNEDLGGQPMKQSFNRFEVDGDIDELTIQKYGFDPRSRTSILARLNNGVENLYELAPPGLWKPIHVALFLQKLVDMAAREYIDMVNEGDKLLVIVL